jgi:hypothetical protein
MLFVELVKGILFVELMKAMGGWLWHNDRIDKRPELVIDLLGGLVAKTAKGKMENIAGGVGRTAWCD